MKIIPAIFEEREIRRLYDEKTETWFFPVVDIVQILTQQPDFQAARITRNARIKNDIFPVCIVHSSMQ